MEISKNGVNPHPSPDPGETSSTGRRYGGIDHQERQRQRREKLIAAALAVFGEQGYHPSTVRDVCRRAELTSRYFYESFTGMDALFEAVYVSVSRDLMQQTMKALQSAPMDPERLAESAVRTFLEFIREDPRRARVTLIDAQNVGAGTSRVSNDANRDFATLIAGFIDLLYPGLQQKTGLSPTLVGVGLTGAVIRIATSWVEDKCAMPLEDVLRNMMGFYVAAIQYADKLLSQQAASSSPPASV